MLIVYDFDFASKVVHIVDVYVYVEGTIDGYEWSNGG